MKTMAAATELTNANLTKALDAMMMDAERVAAAR